MAIFEVISKRDDIDHRAVICLEIYYDAAVEYKGLILLVSPFPLLR
jgi:hypothetical protein